MSSGLRPFSASSSASAGKSSASRSTAASVGLCAPSGLSEGSLSESEMVLMVIGVLPGHKGRIGHHDHTHFIGQTHAHLGGLTVRLVLDNGEQVVGVAAPPPESDGADELDTTGYVDCVSIGGVPVPLSDDVEASIHRPPLA